VRKNDRKGKLVGRSYAHRYTGVISKAETWLALQSTIWKTFSYPLNATNLMKAQCEKIMSPAINYALPNMGICRNFPRSLVFSPTNYSGLGIKHLHTLQEIVRIKDIIHHTYIKSTTGQLYRVSLEYLILELGMTTKLSSIHYSTYHMLVTNSLVKNTWEFLHAHNIDMEHDITVPKNRVDDRSIMMEFTKYNPSTSELEAINHCRLFLKAYYISDIATASGNTLSYHVWVGEPRQFGKTSRFNWPTQGRPSTTSWDIWRGFLKMAILGRGMRLKTSLGPWLPRPGYVAMVLLAFVRQLSSYNFRKQYTVTFQAILADEKQHFFISRDPNVSTP
jgi:hypothetical protein